MVNENVLNQVKLEIENYLYKENFNGAILISIKDKKLISKGFGMANFELDVKNTNVTKFRIGSITKQFTAATILQLYDKGVLNLTDTLDKYINDYPKGKNITIHNLLTHTAGVFNYTDIEEFSNIMRKSHKTIDLINNFKHLPYDFEPGTNYKYSNSGYTLLGDIIEKATNKTYEEYIRENFFKKLSMNNSGYDSNTKIIKNRASGYDLKIYNNDEHIVKSSFIDMSVPFAAGGLYSTVEDLYIWNRALINGNVIDKSLLNKMTERHISAGKDGYYGYGVFINNLNFNDKIVKRISHSGRIPGFFSANNIFPDENVQIVMITNITSKQFKIQVKNVESILFKSI
ncbi:serine hydrolase domain-containing protein [Clostridium senegalense]|uniref:serine hydrolase domain-containing protein n=1 Tax=Clostridium senegalense TaxID=1465809 RepID=UPI000287E225|nr:serine hydrolase domain-containing protein [Clostridium senegalense]